MKTVKLLLMLTFVVPAFAMDLKQSRKEAMRRADIALGIAIWNCDQEDGQHALRMNELKEATYNLSALEVNYILNERFGEVTSEPFYSRLNNCDDCKDIKSFVDQCKLASSYEIREGKGNMLVRDLREEYMKRTENK